MKKLLGIFCWLLMLPHLLWGADEPMPESIQRWIHQAKFFNELDYLNDAYVQNALIKYYTRVYTGELLNRFIKYIRNGSIYSDYYRTFSDSRDFITSYQLHKLDSTTENVYELFLRRKQCHDVNYNFSNGETLIADQKVTNLTQEQFNAWLNQFFLPIEDAMFCLAEQKIVKFTLTASKPLLIIKAEHRIVESEIELIPLHPPKKKN